VSASRSALTTRSLTYPCTPEELRSGRAGIPILSYEAVAMAGYSGTPLPKKLGIKEGHRVALIRPPKDFKKTLGQLPERSILQVGMAGKKQLDVIVVFLTHRAELERELASMRRRMAPAAGLWAAWPKKASGVVTDMTEHVVREIALPTGLVDNKVCAIDDTWSGLRLVIRLEHRHLQVHH
jgi:hypothetical protein